MVPCAKLRALDPRYADARPFAQVNGVRTSRGRRRIAIHDAQCPRRESLGQIDRLGLSGLRSGLLRFSRRPAHRAEGDDNAE